MSSGYSLSRKILEMGEGPKRCAELSHFGTEFATTRAEIYLDRLQSNVHNLKAFIGPTVHLMAVVKADGYGHGAVAVAKAAVHAGAFSLGVYTMPEAIYLRKAGITASIMVFGPIDPWAAKACVSHDVTPCITSLEFAEALSMAASAAGKRVRFHIELDTGLSRYGIRPQDAVSFVQALDRLPALEREGVFTHFATADEPLHEPARKQFKIFMKICKMLDANSVPFPLRHAAASAATLEFPEMHLDLVRCGISIYGYYPSIHVSRQVDLQPVMALGSQLARVHSVSRGVGVSYGYDWRAAKKSVIGLVPFGYADGMPRTVQGRGQILVRGQRAPIVGRVAMDQFMVDLTAIKDVGQGDEVTIIGRSGEEEISADDIGQWAGTISYDVLSGISPRVPRLYLDGGKPVAQRQAMTTELVAL